MSWQYENTFRNRRTVFKNVFRRFFTFIFSNFEEAYFCIYIFSNVKEAMQLLAFRRLASNHVRGRVYHLDYKEY